VADRYACFDSFNDYIVNYDRFPKISFDYEVAEKADSIGVVRFDGEWKDLGTWNALTDELSETKYGNVTTDGTDINTHLFNELPIPLICIGTHDLVIAASRDGILITEKSKSESIKDLATCVKTQPMFEECSWGSFSIIDREEFSDGIISITRRIEVKSGCEFEIKDFLNHSKVWSIIHGDGEVTINGVCRKIRRGDVITIPENNKCSLKAMTPLMFVEVSTTCYDEVKS
ncbi:MAG: mannose-1-phosphate guanylyltransferase, partial [Candidatus Amulumruptor sp.]|nr:mannose-1-phosphate guanylyltransferase [Candidatus Amulumruptor sp.]